MESCYLCVEKIDLGKLRVTGAEPGRVDFELDIKKEHTVRKLC